MRKELPITLLSCALGLLLLPAAAPAPAPEWIDRKAPVEDARVAAALKTAMALPSVPESVIRQVGPMLYADNALTPGESDLILELLDNRTTKVRITSGNESFD